MNLIKNVPGFERGLRIVVGTIALVGGSVWAFSGNPVWGILVAASGLSLAATGLTGWCPMCAIAGRKLSDGKSVVPIGKLEKNFGHDRG